MTPGAQDGHCWAEQFSIRMMQDMGCSWEGNGPLWMFLDIHKTKILRYSLIHPHSLSHPVEDEKGWENYCPHHYCSHFVPGDDLWKLSEIVMDHKDYKRDRFTEEQRSYFSKFCLPVGMWPSSSRKHLEALFLFSVELWIYMPLNLGPI